MTTTTRVTVEQVHEALGRVPDPEMPPISVAELGMVVDVAIRGDGGDNAVVEIALVPTYSGCPAIAVIREDVTAAVRGLPGVADVDVRFVNDPVWEPDRITESGRAKLAEFGIAPPGSGQTLLGIGGVTCPICGSRDTVADSPFGPTPCRSSHYCKTCRNPFETIKP